jgi:hypothetical protein
MVITTKTVADQILKYINRKISLPDLVDWAEDAIQEADFDKRDVNLLRDVVGRLGLADVKEFGLTWDDCYEHLHKLGYDISVTVSKTA